MFCVSWSRVPPKRHFCMNSASLLPSTTDFCLWTSRNWIHGINPTRGTKWRRRGSQTYGRESYGRLTESETASRTVCGLGPNHARFPKSRASPMSSFYAAWIDDIVEARRVFSRPTRVLKQRVQLHRVLLHPNVWNLTHSAVVCSFLLIGKLWGRDGKIRKLKLW